MPKVWSLFLFIEREVKKEVPDEKSKRQKVLLPENISFTYPKNSWFNDPKICKYFMGRLNLWFLVLLPPQITKSVLINKLRLTRTHKYKYNTKGVRYYDLFHGRIGARENIIRFGENLHYFKEEVSLKGWLWNPKEADGKHMKSMFG